MKRIALALCLCLLCAVLPASAEEESATLLSWEELSSWVEGYRLRAMQEELLNDPADPQALTEDGYMFVYSFGTLYMSRPDLSEASRVRNLVVIGEEDAGPRGLHTDLPAASVLSAFYNENPELDGSRDIAALYAVDDLPRQAAWGWVVRDGQRLEVIQYTVHEPADGAYTDAGLVFTLQEGMVAAIRAYGLDQRISLEEVRSGMSEVQEAITLSGYAQVPFSTDGSALEPFNEEDLIFSGVNLLDFQPEDALERFGEAEEDWIDNGEDGWLENLAFGDCLLTYAWDRERQSSRLMMMTVRSPQLEAPRGVRLGDSLSSVLCRFRSGEGSYDEAAGTEVLYQNGEGSGTAQYGADASAVLRYALNAEGQTVTLQIHFELLQASEIILRIEQP